MKLVFPGGEHPQVLLDPGVNRVGSDPGGQVVLDRPGIGPRLCQLHVTAQGVMLDVADGAVRVNDRPVDGLIALRPGDVVDLGGVQARLAALGAVAPGDATGDSVAAAAANDDLGATTVHPVVPQFVLRGVGGSVFGRHVPVRGTVTFGRAPECTVPVDDRGLSRLHARLLADDGRLVFEDLGSSNGSFVNGRRVLRTQVGDGDEIAMDSVRFRVVSNVRAGAAPPPERAPARGAPWRWAAWGAVVVAAVALAGVFLPG
jgi:pSer/pThr/pTyr-binding forkhead associated (FHA) protein